MTATFTAQMPAAFTAQMPAAREGVAHQAVAFLPAFDGYAAAAPACL